MSCNMGEILTQNEEKAFILGRSKGQRQERVPQRGGGNFIPGDRQNSAG